MVDRDLNEFVEGGKHDEESGKRVRTITIMMRIQP
jgi:hypothetical protein